MNKQKNDSRNDQTIDDFDDFDGFNELDYLEKPKKDGFLKRYRDNAAKRRAAKESETAEVSDEDDEIYDDEGVEEEDMQYAPEEVQLDEETVRRIRRRHERQRRRRRNERIISAVSILLVILCIAFFVFYLFFIRTGKFTVPGGNDVNVYQLATQAPDAGDQQSYDDNSTSGGETTAADNGNGSTSSGLSADGLSWANLPPTTDGNNLLDLIMAGGGNHAVFLTFDDGPTENITPQILDILAEYGVKATFFETGANIEANHEMAERVAAEGHCIAGHSYSHDYDTLYATEESFVDEVQRTYDLIAGLYPANEPPMKLMRFPGGSYNAGDHAAEKQIYKETLKQMGFYYADWNCLNGDAEGAQKNAAELYQYFVNSVSTNNLVVLMHDAATKQETVNALPQIIEYCQANGYEFRTLNDIVYEPAAENGAAEETIEDTAAEEQQ